MLVIGNLILIGTALHSKRVRLRLMPKGALNPKLEELVRWTHALRDTLNAKDARICVQEHGT